MIKKIIKPNTTFFRLTTISVVEQKGPKKWNCVCQCGTKKIIRDNDLKRKKVKSCGCLLKENVTNKTHGLYKTPMHNTWKQMLNRTRNKNTPLYRLYGGRGITVCDRWLKFKNFYADMGSSHKNGLSLDRIDNNKGYYKENCRWATPKQQARNRRCNKTIDYNGDKKTIAEWAEILNLSSGDHITRRLRRGWSIEKAITTPSMFKNKNK